MVTDVLTLFRLTNPIAMWDLPVPLNMFITYMVRVTGILMALLAPHLHLVVPLEILLGV